MKNILAVTIIFPLTATIIPLIAAFTFFELAEASAAVLESMMILSRQTITDQPELEYKSFMYSRNDQVAHCFDPHFYGQMICEENGYAS